MAVTGVFGTPVNLTNFFGEIAVLMVRHFFGFETSAL